jgi:hypothetical protein
VLSWLPKLPSHATVAAGIISMEVRALDPHWVDAVRSMDGGRSKPTKNCYRVLRDLVVEALLTTACQ